MHFTPCVRFAAESNLRNECDEENGVLYPPSWVNWPRIYYVTVTLVALRGIMDVHRACPVA
jgi:hypothetical protein